MADLLEDILFYEDTASGTLIELAKTVEKLVYDEEMRWLIIIQWPNVSDTYFYGIKAMEWARLRGNETFEEIRWLGWINDNAIFTCTDSAGNHIALNVTFNDNYEMTGYDLKPISNEASGSLESLENEINY